MSLPAGVGSLSAHPSQASRRKEPHTYTGYYGPRVHQRVYVACQNCHREFERVGYTCYNCAAVVKDQGQGAYGMVDGDPRYKVQIKHRERMVKPPPGYMPTMKEIWTSIEQALEPCEECGLGMTHDEIVRVTGTSTATVSRHAARLRYSYSREPNQLVVGTKHTLEMMLVPCVACGLIPPQREIAQALGVSQSQVSRAAKLVENRRVGVRRVRR